MRPSPHALRYASFTVQIRKNARRRSSSGNDSSPSSSLAEKYRRMTPSIPAIARTCSTSTPTSWLTGQSDQRSLAGMGHAEAQGRARGVRHRDTACRRPSWPRRRHAGQRADTTPESFATPRDTPRSGAGRPRSDSGVRARPRPRRAREKRRRCRVTRSRRGLRHAASTRSGRAPANPVRSLSSFPPRCRVAPCAVFAVGKRIDRLPPTV